MPIWFALFQLLQNPLILLESGALDPAGAHPINPTSALGLALQDGTDKLFLGMNLSVSPSQAFAVSLATAIPYLIMMAIMVATQYVQQWHATYGQTRPTDQKGAGAQQAITKIMPLFIGFISWNFPAGLVLVLDNFQPVPTRATGPDFQDGRSPQARCAQRWVAGEWRQGPGGRFGRGWVTTARTGRETTARRCRQAQEAEKELI